MSRQRKGSEFEREQSIIIHQRGVALLIDPRILRSRGLGQVDLASIERGVIKIYELKSALLGYSTLSQSQRSRLRGSAEFLGALLQRPVCTRLISKQLSVAF